MDFATEYNVLTNNSTVAVGKIVEIDTEDNIGIGLPIVINSEQCANIADLKVGDVTGAMWYSHNSLFGCKWVVVQITHIERPEIAYIKLGCNSTMSIQQALMQNGAEIIGEKRLKVGVVVDSELINQSVIEFIIQQGGKRFTVSVADERESPRGTTFIIAVKPCQ